jgi:signal transduction histidine kinase/CHASE3 domain sensor protein
MTVQASVQSYKARRLMIGSSVMIVIAVAVLSMFLFREFFSVSQASEWVSHTYRVRGELFAAQSDMRDAESAQRGYLLTGDKTFLDRYDNALVALNDRLKRLRELIGDNPHQMGDLFDAVKIIDAKKKEMSYIIQIFDESGQQAAIERLKTNRGRHLMNQLRQQFKEMEDEENRVLIERDASFKAGTQLFIAVFSGLAAAITTLLVAYAYFMRRFILGSEVYQRDITAQKKLFSSDLESLSDGVMVANKAGEFVVTNPAAAYLTGITQHTAPSSEWTKTYGCFLPDGVTPFPNDQLPLLRAIRGETVINEELLLKSENLPRPVWLSISGTPVVSESGKSDLGVIVFRDVTDRKMAERRITEFISTVSHELRTPLTSIKGALRIIEGGLAGQLSPRATELIRVASEETERLIRLVNDILDLRKIEEGKLELKFVDLPIDTLVTRAVEAVYGMTSETNIVVDQGVGPVILKCDEDRILQVVVNLLSNALKFSPKGSTITLKTEMTEGGLLRLSIIDQGQGISPEDLKKLFGRFQQLDSSDTRQKGGSGLGLAISKGIVEQHRGKIGVDTDLGKGSTFWFELPVNATLLDATDKPAKLEQSN